MKIQELNPSIAGYPLHRLLLTPDPEVALKGSLLFFHGQGDFIDRYPPILENFVQAGYQCLLTDFPGHGQSTGRRGVVPGFKIVDQIIADSLAHLDKTSGPTIIAGHSMGGLMALRYFLQEPDRFAAAWFSSPLLDPMEQAKPWMRILLPMASHLLPWLRVSTGVSAQDCGEQNDGSSVRSEESKPLYHNRISLLWGRQLAQAAEELSEQFPNFPTKIPILFTQGSDDPVCPAEILRTRLAKLPENKISYQEISQAKHEPFTGQTSEEFIEILKEWIQKTL